MKRKFLRHIDLIIPLTVVVLIIFGLIIIASATHYTVSPDISKSYLIRQIAAFILGLIGVVVILVTDYRILKDYIWINYSLMMLLLIMTLVFGETVSGSKSWIRIGGWSFQPSELCKIAFILSLAAFLDDLGKNIRNLSGLLKSLLFLIPPLVLILLQNDLGTALVFIAILAGMLFVAGMDWRWFLGIFGGGLLLAVLLILAHLHLGLPLPIRQYQLMRLIVFWNPYVDPTGAGYNVIQSQIAIGSGGILGKGLFQGTQNYLGFLPEQHTDFIFSVVGEELGFIGAVCLLLLFFIFLWRGLDVGIRAKDRFGSLVVSGVVSMFLFHILENIGMTIGLMPVTGLPLPFISSGGSALMANLLAVGLILNIDLRKRKIYF